MSSSDLIRWGGLAAVLGGVMWVAMGLLAIITVNSEARYMDALFIVTLLLVLGGMVGLHALQKENYERIGRAGFYLVIVGSLAMALSLVVLLAGSEALEWLAALGSFGLLIGFVLYGAASLQAKVLPRWCGVGLIVGLPATIFLRDYGLILFGILWLALGYMLLSRSGAVTEQPSRVR